MSIVHIGKANFEELVLKSEKKVLLDFWAPWCGPCKMIAPFVEEIAEEREDIKVCKVDVDQEPELAAQYQVASIPTLFVIEKGEVVNHSLGAKPKAKILEML